MDHLSVFTPHGYCVLWDRWIMGREILGNLLTALSYFSIPLSLLLIRHRIRGIMDTQRLKFAISLFALFILCCGVGHVIDIVTIWYPVYHLESWWKMVTGLVSVFTAAAISPEITRYLRTRC